MSAGISAGSGSDPSSVRLKPTVNQATSNVAK
jgi:hypothetical protein